MTRFDPHDPWPADDPFLPSDYSSRHCDNCGASYRPDLGHSCRTREQPAVPADDGRPLWTAAAVLVGLPALWAVLWAIWRWL